MNRQANEKATAQFAGEIKAVNEEERSVVHVITDSTIDRYGEIVDPRGVDWTEYDKNRVVLFGHDYRGSGNVPVVGDSMWMKLEGERIISKTRFAKSTAFANDVWNLVKDGFLRATSIGFLPIEMELVKLKKLDLNPPNRKDYDEDYEIPVWRKVELLEYSIVPIPANPNAIQLALQRATSGEMRHILTNELNEARLCELEGCKSKMEKMFDEAMQKVASQEDEIRLLKEYMERINKQAKAEPEKVGIVARTLTPAELQSAIEAATRGAISRLRGKV